VYSPAPRTMTSEALYEVEMTRWKIRQMFVCWHCDQAAISLEEDREKTEKNDNGSKDG